MNNDCHYDDHDDYQCPEAIRTYSATIKLSEEDAKVFFAALANPPPLNEKMKEALKEYNRRRNMSDKPLKEYSVLERLPDHGQKVLALGHLTFCCKDDAEEFATWNEVIFEMNVVAYRLKKEMPKDLEASVLDYFRVEEYWEIDEHDPKRHLIGVTHWRSL